MFRRGEERNYGVLIASIVAIVAIVGMVVYFGGGSAGGAAVAYSELGDAAYNACTTGNLPAGADVSRMTVGVGGTLEFTRCTAEVCSVLCAGQPEGCDGYCTGRAESIARSRPGVW
ncbi:hypothetical protein HY641_04210 [Candidatus Woesearchaeota archaeon]|nr:hypothetical protein [Candidatus Woesearchaeota archaeon]